MTETRLTITEIDEALLALIDQVEHLKYAKVMLAMKLHERDLDDEYENLAFLLHDLRMIEGFVQGYCIKE